MVLNTLQTRGLPMLQCAIARGKPRDPVALNLTSGKGSAHVVPPAGPPAFPRLYRNFTTNTEAKVVADTRKDHSGSYGSSLYIPFMGSSSRFTFESPILTLEDITALESEPLSHSPPKFVSDHCCICLVKLLRWCADKVFRERYLHRATMLKIIAPAPSFAGAIVTFFRMMLRKKKKTNMTLTGKGMQKNTTSTAGESAFAGEVRGLLAQAESHACHAYFLMLMTDITYVERVTAISLQMMQVIIFSLLFMLHPRMAFRLMGYLGEESVVIWTHMINDIDLGKVSERAIPRAALDYWSLHHFKTLNDSPNEGTAAEHFNHENKAEIEQHLGTAVEEITLRDVLLLLRSDEILWRDVCHQMADKMDEVREKRKSRFSSFFFS